MEGRTYRGHDGVREWWTSMQESLAARFRPEQIEVFRDRAIARVRIVGTIDRVEVPQTMWQAVRFRDGLVCWWGTYRTEEEALEAAGLRG